MIKAGGHSYQLTPEDLSMEQEEFETGDGVSSCYAEFTVIAQLITHLFHDIVLFQKELVDNFGVYISYLDLESRQLASKGSASGLMRQLMSVWYRPERLAESAASCGINGKIRTALFSVLLHCYCKFTAIQLYLDMVNIP